MDFDKLYRNMLNFKPKDGELNRVEIRASGMPFCYRKLLLASTEHRVNNYPFFFYVNIGTEIHNVVQQWFPKVNPNVLFGDWACKNLNCGKWEKDPNINLHRFTPYTIHHKLGPIMCPKCKKMMRYEELSMRFLDAPVTGHCDGVLLDVKEDHLPVDITKTTVDAWVLELKSTSRWNCSNIKEPKLAHKLQATVYVSALRRILRDSFGYKINIKGYIIKYISRDNPASTSASFKVPVKKDLYYKNTCYLVKRLYTAIRKNKVDLLYAMPCRKWPKIYAECGYKSACEGLERKTLQKIWSNQYESFKQLLNQDLQILKGDD